MVVDLEWTAPTATMMPAEQNSTPVVAVAAIQHGNTAPSPDAPPYLRTTDDVGSMLHHALWP
jgi:hypothetical protein